MKSIPRGKYTREFREEAVKLVIEEKLSWGKAGCRLNLAPSTIGNWVKAYQEGKLGEIGKTYRPLTEVEMELARVKKENAELRMERDILKKLPRTLPGSRCPVRGHEKDAVRLSHPTPQPYASSLLQWILRLGRPAVIEARPGGITTGVGD